MAEDALELMVKDLASKYACGELFFEESLYHWGLTQQAYAEGACWMGDPSGVYAYRAGRLGQQVAVFCPYYDYTQENFHAFLEKVRYQ